MQVNRSRMTGLRDQKHFQYLRKSAVCSESISNPTEHGHLRNSSSSDEEIILCGKAHHCYVCEPQKSVQSVLWLGNTCEYMVLCTLCPTLPCPGLSSAALRGPEIPVGVSIFESQDQVTIHGNTTVPIADPHWIICM